MWGGSKKDKVSVFGVRGEEERKIYISIELAVSPGLFFLNLFLFFFLFFMS